MTQKQFDEACERRGFQQVGVLGYYRLAPPAESVSVSARNGGSKRRAQLAYLIQQQFKWEKKLAEKSPCS